jgi:hypothetical protein
MADFSGAADITSPDLHTQFEDLLTHVLRCESWERLEDRIDLAIRFRRDSPTDLPRAES